ncbi:MULTISPECIES: OsmC family protein [Actinomadura]|uniref:OsmC family protein n=1 Tax=Actinomadura yumaensis TaxID=111807 RepID=A0ABW2CYI8_9ACTN|nr:OsmC family protein [Actinomadura sp. J1-007]MWK35156.1 OsmC family peroxiredoxin [Actinomadura sp. J1-007]
MIEARALPVPNQVEYRTDLHAGLADTAKNGVGGAEGPRPHELLEAAFASCVTMTARMALADLGVTGDVHARVWLEREDDATRFRYALTLPPSLTPAQRTAVLDRVERSPVRRTLTKPLSFVPAD